MKNIVDTSTADTSQAEKIVIEYNRKGVRILDQELFDKLRRITAEERAILDGRSSIDRELYMSGSRNVINSEKLLSAGKLITVRPHTRFLPFPEHRHDYVELVYMCSGSTTHIVNGKTIRLEQGELLFLNQKASHEIQRAGLKDVAVNFIVLPRFFDTVLPAIGEEETPLRRFLVNCLCMQDTGPGYLHFRVSKIKPVQNLMENLLWTLLEETPNRRKQSQMTMALLFLLLIGNAQTLVTEDREEAAVLRLLQYVEKHYADGSLTQAAQMLHCDVSWLSREIKNKTGKTYTQLVQERRLAQAAYLLRSTDRIVSDVAISVGYENISYFHRIFTEFYGKTPRHYRLEQ